MKHKTAKFITGAAVGTAAIGAGGLVYAGFAKGWGPFAMLSQFQDRLHPGNRYFFDSDNVDTLAENPLRGKNVLFLGSSVTFGAASLEDGIPEYFEKRFGCIATKEAVSGTTLVDSDEGSYVSRLMRNVETYIPYSLVICQLSTNDATQGKPLGEISETKKEETFDTLTITGAMEKIIAYCQRNWNCPVFFYTGSRYESENYKAMVHRLYELAKKWDIGVLDLWNDDDFNAISKPARRLYMKDQIHPTKAGYMKWWCPELERQLLTQLEIRQENGKQQ